MIEIHFQRIEDATPFYQLIKKNLVSSQPDKTILLDEDRNIVVIMTNELPDDCFFELKKMFFDYILQIKCEDWFRALITEQYFYTDEEEIRQILDIIHSILEGEREDIAMFIKDIDIKAVLKHAVNHIMKKTISFSFDSFVKFSLRPFKDKLEKYVEISIDEYKMEQEYQVFIQTLREFISNRSPRLNSLHLLFDEEVIFFDEQFLEIKRIELIKMIDRKLLFNHPVYVDSTTIAPLLSIAPQAIYVYSREQDQPLIRTIRNIFEEKVLVDNVSVFEERRHLYSQIKKRIP